MLEGLKKLTIKDKKTLDFFGDVNKQFEEYFVNLINLEENPQQSIKKAIEDSFINLSQYNITDSKMIHTICLFLSECNLEFADQVDLNEDILFKDFNWILNNAVQYTIPKTPKCQIF